MKIHTERPKRGNARLAWDYFTEHRGSAPLDMSYSYFCAFDEGPSWVATYPPMGTSVNHNTQDLASVTNTELEWWSAKRNQKT